jgi:hypothetical protein
MLFGKLEYFRILGNNVFNIETASVTHNDLVNLHQHFSLELILYKLF